MLGPPNINREPGSKVLLAPLQNSWASHQSYSVESNTTSSDASIVGRTQLVRPKVVNEAHQQKLEEEVATEPTELEVCYICGIPCAW